MIRPNVTFHVGFACTSNIPGAKGDKGEPGLDAVGIAGRAGLQGPQGPPGRVGPMNPASGTTTFIRLTDTPRAYDHSKRMLKTAQHLAALEFTDTLKAGSF